MKLDANFLTELANCSEICLTQEIDEIRLADTKVFMLFDRHISKIFRVDSLQLFNAIVVIAGRSSITLVDEFGCHLNDDSINELRKIYICG